MQMDVHLILFKLVYFKQDNLIITSKLHFTVFCILYSDQSLAAV